MPTVEEIILNGEEYFVAYSPMPPIGGGIAAAAPADEVTARAAPITAGLRDEGARTLQVMLAALGGLFVAGLAGAGYLNRRLLVAPLQRLAAATREVAGGDLTAQVAVARNDELGELASDFNVMVQKLRESERELEQRVEDRTRELATLLEVARNVGSTLELQPLLQLILEQVRTVVPYDRSLIMIRDDDALRVLAIRAEPGFEMEQSQLKIRAPIADGGLIWELVERGEPAIIEDTHENTALAELWRKNNDSALEAALLRVGSWMAVPMRLGDVTIGMLVASKEQRNFFTRGHAELATAIGTHAAMAITNAQLYERAQQAASLEERQRLARELHDSVSQALYGIALGAQTARLRIDKDPSTAIEPIEYTMSLAQAGLAEMRALIFELRPESLESEGLVAALEKQISATEARHGLSIATQLGDEPECRIEVKEALYRIAQEALHNVVKHARAGEIRVELSGDEGALHLTISDDGAGFDVTATYPGHVGLLSMPERAAKLGGYVTIDSAPGRGTTVAAHIPLSPL
jgi:signal transduction histidine kinase